MKTHRFCIHIGLSKTATTTLQHHLFPHHSQIEYLGKYIGRKPKYRDLNAGHLIEQIIKKRLVRKQVEALKRICNDQVKPCLDPKRVAVVSTEGISTGPLGNRKRRAMNFKAVFGPCKIVVVLRHPLSLMESLYFQKLKESNLRKKPIWVKCPHYFSIDQWLARYWKKTLSGPLWHLDYFRTIKTYCEVFGDANVGIFLYEQLKENPSAFFTQLCDFMGIDNRESMRLTAHRRDNVRWTEAHLDRLKNVQASFGKAVAFRFSSSTQRKETLGLMRNDHLTATEKAKAEISNVWKKRIIDYTLAGNKTLIQTRGLQLEHYGYPV